MQVRCEPHRLWPLVLPCSCYAAVGNCPACVDLVVATSGGENTGTSASESSRQLVFGRSSSRGKTRSRNSLLDISRHSALSSHGEGITTGSTREAYGVARPRQPTLSFTHDDDQDDEKAAAASSRTSAVPIAHKRAAALRSNAGVSGTPPSAAAMDAYAAMRTPSPKMTAANVFAAEGDTVRRRLK